jgi:3-oxoacyl-[acyl-carrier-protein] synthase II
MERVVITGVGVVSPIGSGRQQFWSGLLEGKCGIGPVTSFDTSAYPVHIGAEVRDFVAAPYFERLNSAGICRASQMSVAAARMALADASLDLARSDRWRIGVSMGTTSGEAECIERYNDSRKQPDEAACAGKALAGYPSHMIPRHVAIELDVHGPCVMIPAACAAGNFAIGYGLDAIRMGRADLMLSGGADRFTRIPYTGFARLGAIAPERCQPFDRNRKGMVPGEGAAVLVLEKRDAALARGAKIYAEVLGYGVSCDSHHMTAAHPQGDGAIRAMQAAMRESGVTTDDIDYISAHGTGTPTNDRVEAMAVRTLFGPRAGQVPMSSIKSMLGHTMGAASAIEAVACALALDTGWIPPTINHETPDEDCTLDFVPNRARHTSPKVILNNAYAFGGNNASLCLTRHDG